MDTCLYFVAYSTISQYIKHYYSVNSVGKTFEQCRNEVLEHYKKNVIGEEYFGLLKNSFVLLQCSRASYKKSKMQIELT